MKKFLSLILIFAMLLSLPLAVMAAEPTPTDISLVNMAFLNGGQFYQYDPAQLVSTGDTSSFICDGEFFTKNPAGLNPVTGEASGYAMLQYRYAMEGDYSLSYQVKLNAENKDRLYTMFYWQDYTQNGRSYQTSQRGTGFSLRLDIADGAVTVSVMAYEPKAGGGTRISSPTSGVATSNILEGADANALLNVNLKWETNVLTASVSLASDASKTTGDVVYDLSGQSAILSAITDPAGFGFLFAPVESGITECASIGHISYTDYGAEEQPVVDPDYNYLVLNATTYATLADGNKFVRGEDGWFTRATDAAATDNAVIASKNPSSYNYTLSFKWKLNADNRGRVGLWNIWDGLYYGSHYGYMFNLSANEDGSLVYRLARYDGSYSTGNHLITADTAANAEGVTILKDQPANAELLITVTVQDKTLSVDVCLASDPSVKAGTVTYDFSAGSERTINRTADRTLGFAIMDMAGQENLVSASYGDIVYTALPGEAPSGEDEDTNDYQSILDKNDYGWSGDVAVTEDNFSIYSYNGQNYELFSIQDGWLTRTNENGETNSEDSAIRTGAYAMAQYKGVMDGGDYKLTFKVKGDSTNNLRFSVLTRWEDKDGNSFINFKNQIGYRIYFYTDAGILYVRCYRTGGAGYLSPLPATAANASALDLNGLNLESLELTISIVMKDDLIVAEAHLSSDATKTTGPVAFDMSDDVNLMSQIDRTQGFCVVDSANELSYGPASFGEFHVYALTEPQVSNGNGDGPDDPDENLETEGPDNNTTTAAPEEDSKPSDGEATTSTPEDPAKGCSSQLSVVPFAVILLISTGAVMIGRKKREE